MRCISNHHQPQAWSACKASLPAVVAAAPHRPAYTQRTMLSLAAADDTKSEPSFTQLLPSVPEIPKATQLPSGLPGQWAPSTPPAKLASNELIERLKAEAGERATLQQQLVDAQVQALQATLTAESTAAELELVRSQRAALESKADRQGENLALLEARLTKLWAESQALQAESEASRVARDTLLRERNQLIAQMQQLQQEKLAGEAQAVTAAQQSTEALQSAVQAGRQREQEAALKVAELSTQLSQTRSSLYEVQQRLSAARQEAQRLQEQLAQAQAVQEALEAKLAADVQTQLDKPQDTMQQWTQQQELQLQEVSAELAAAQAELAQATDELAQVQHASTQRLQEMQGQAQRTAMQLQASERERQLEVSVIVTNYINAMQQGAVAAAVADQLQAEVETLREANQQLVAQQGNLAAGQAARQQVLVLQAQVDALQQQLSQTEQLRIQQQQAAATAEQARAALEQEVQLVSHRLQISEDMAARRAAVLRTIQPHSYTARILPAGVHSNTNRYWAPADQKWVLMKVLALREATWSNHPGFLCLDVQLQGDQVIATSIWNSREAFEAWSNDKQAEAQLPAMPPGVMQYMPASKGEGVPETHLPIKHAL